MKFLLLISACWMTIAALQPVEKTAVSGKITDEAGRPIADATILILKPGRVLRASLSSDSEGRYRHDVEPGTYQIECFAAGYTTLRYVDVALQPNVDNTLDFTMKKDDGLEETVVRRYDAAAHGALTSEEVRVRELRSSVPAEPEKPRYAYDKKAAAKARKTMPEAKPVPATAPPSGEEVAKDELAVMRYDKPDAGVAPTVHDDLPAEVAGEKIVPPPGGPMQPAPRAGLLTAGEWNDLHNWNRHWADIQADGEIDAYQIMYGFFPKQRFAVLLTNEQNFPLIDAVVLLKNGADTLWQARTDNTGKAELWAGLFDKKEYAALEAEALVGGETRRLGRLKPAKDGINRFTVDAECETPKNVDIVWAVDATGSMGDEIEYLKTELLDVIGRARGRNPELSFRMGTVFYRDVSDAYITSSSGLSPDIAKTVEFIRKQSADGGGDYPEAVHSALEEAIFLQNWSDQAVARICFLVLDASPHRSPEINASLRRSITEAARLGIRIVPVTASGIQKDTEFLMKFFGLATNGTYVFLTDHSGIGGKHLEPTTDEYKVEALNELLVRLISEYTAIGTCEGKSTIRFEDDPQQQQQQTWQALYYPNPASTQFTLELPFDVQSVTLYNAEGKAVRKLEKPQAGQNSVIVSDLAEGFYTIRILKEGRMQSGKLLVVRG